MAMKTDVSDDVAVNQQGVSDDVEDAARKLGFKRINAWVPEPEPDDQRGEQTKGAERVRRSRERAAQLGRRQLSVTLPVDLHPVIRELAARTKAGESCEVVLADLLEQIREKLSGDSSCSSQADGVTLATGRATWLGLMRWLCRVLIRWFHATNVRL
jgi:hypothetical protein